MGMLFEEIELIKTAHLPPFLRGERHATTQHSGPASPSLPTVSRRALKKYQGIYSSLEYAFSLRHRHGSPRH